MVRSPHTVVVGGSGGFGISAIAARNFGISAIGVVPKSIVHMGPALRSSATSGSRMASPSSTVMSVISVTGPDLGTHLELHAVGIAEEQRPLRTQLLDLTDLG